MRAAVLQVKPELCGTPKAFAVAIEKSVASAMEFGPDLIVFPECLGLWMCTMFGGKTPPASVASLSDEKSLYERAVLLQLDGFSEAGIQSTAGIIQKVANAIFSVLPLGFLGRWMRSKRQMAAYRSAFSAAAKKHVVTIQAGSIFDLTRSGVKNVAYTFGPDGKVISRQEKIHPIPFETMLGIKGGSDVSTFDVGEMKCGVAICYDANFPNDVVQKLADKGCRFVCCPSGGIIPSHAWKWDYDRDLKNVTVARSEESGVVIGRSYNSGDLIPGVLMFAGRSSVTAPKKETTDGSGVAILAPDEGPHVLIYEVLK